MIPTKIHQIWLGEQPIPRKFDKYIESWKLLNPKWDYKLWTDKDVFKLQNQALYDKCNILAEQADILRYEILYNEGGLYVDVDYECLKNIDPIITPFMDLYLCMEAINYTDNIPRFVNNGLIGSTPKHPFIKRLINNLPARYAEWERLPNKDELCNTWRAGPHYLTDLLTNDKTYYPIYPVETFNGKYASHHYAGSWVKPEGRRNDNTKDIS